MWIAVLHGDKHSMPLNIKRNRQWNITRAIFKSLVQWEREKKITLNIQWFEIHVIIKCVVVSASQCPSYIEPSAVSAFVSLDIPVLTAHNLFTCRFFFWAKGPSLNLYCCHTEYALTDWMMRNIEVAYTGASLSAISFCHFNTGSTHKSFNEFVIFIRKDCAHCFSFRYWCWEKICVFFCQAYFSAVVPNPLLWRQCIHGSCWASFDWMCFFYIHLIFSLKSDWSSSRKQVNRVSPAAHLDINAQHHRRATERDIAQVSVNLIAVHVRRVHKCVALW